MCVPCGHPSGALMDNTHERLEPHIGALMEHTHERGTYLLESASKSQKARLRVSFRTLPIAQNKVVLKVISYNKESRRFLGGAPMMVF